MTSALLSFPNPVNEKAARVVAAGVFLLGAITLATEWDWLLLPLAYGFLARTLAGPTLSPLGRFATGVVAPRLGPPRPVPGPPKRFEQAIGALLTTAAAVLALGFGAHTAADVLLVALLVAAGLEAAFALCIGCRIFALAMRVGLVPASVCLECGDLTLRTRS
jgi:hypothetical protein